MKKLQPATDHLQGLRLLIIEDEPILALCISEIVESAGCIVVGVASTIADAIKQISSSPFDVALLDLHLHGRSVETVAAAIMSRGRSAVISTGSDIPSIPAEMRHWPVLRKPYKNGALLTALAAVERSP